MFCENCGKPTAEGQTLCPECASKFAPNQETMAADPVTTDYQTVAADPVFPGFETVAAESAPVAEEVPMFTVSAAPAAEPAQKDKKPGKSKLPLILAIIAIVLVAAIVVVAINWNAIFGGKSGKEDSAQPDSGTSINKDDPIAYLKAVEQQNMETTMSELAAAYDTYLEFLSSSAQSSSSTSSVDIEMTETIRQLLQMALSQAGVEFDLSWVKEVNLTLDENTQADGFAYDIGIGVNGTHIVTVQLLMDLNDMIMYIGIPELNKTFLLMDYTQLAGMDAEYLRETMTASTQLINTLAENLPTGEELKTLVNTYWSIILDGITDAEKASETLEVEGVSQDVTTLSYTLSQQELGQILVTAAETAVEDETLKKIINGLSAINTASSGTEYDMYTDFTESLQEFLADSEQWLAEMEGSSSLTVNTYLDSTDAIVGREITVTAEDQQIIMRLLTAVSGEDLGLEMSMTADGDTMKLIASGTKESIEMEIWLPGARSSFLTLEIENAEIENGNVRSALTLVPGDNMIDLLMADPEIGSVAPLLASCAMEMVLESDGETTQIPRLALIAGGEELLVLSASGKITDAADITFPEGGIDINAPTSLEAWLETLVLDQIISGLEKAGLPSEYLGALKALAAFL